MSINQISNPVLLCSFQTNIEETLENPSQKKLNRIPKNLDLRYLLKDLTLKNEVNVLSRERANTPSLNAASIAVVADPILNQSEASSSLVPPFSPSVSVNQTNIEETQENPSQKKLNKIPKSLDLRCLLKDLTLKNEVNALSRERATTPSLNAASIAVVADPILNQSEASSSLVPPFSPSISVNKSNEYNHGTILPEKISSILMQHTRGMGLLRNSNQIDDQTLSYIKEGIIKSVRLQGKSLETVMAEQGIKNLIVPNREQDKRVELNRLVKSVKKIEINNVDIVNYGKIDLHEVEKILKNTPLGTALLRDSRNSDSLVISYMSNDKLLHFRLEEKSLEQALSILKVKYNTDITQFAKPPHG